MSLNKIRKLVSVKAHELQSILSRMRPQDEDQNTEEEQFVAQSTLKLCTVENEDKQLEIDQECLKNPKDKSVLIYDKGHGDWVIGKIRDRVTKIDAIKNSNYKRNYWNFEFVESLTNPQYIPEQINRFRSVNLCLGGPWGEVQSNLEEEDSVNEDETLGRLVARKNEAAEFEFTKASQTPDNEVEVRGNESRDLTKIPNTEPIDKTMNWVKNQDNRSEISDVSHMSYLSGSVYSTKEDDTSGLLGMKDNIESFLTTIAAGHEIETDKLKYQKMIYNLTNKMNRVLKMAKAHGLAVVNLDRCDEEQANGIFEDQENKRKRVWKSRGPDKRTKLQELKRGMASCGELIRKLENMVEGDEETVLEMAIGNAIQQASDGNLDELIRDDIEYLHNVYNNFDQQIKEEESKENNNKSPDGLPPKQNVSVTIENTKIDENKEIQNKVRNNTPLDTDEDKKSKIAETKKQINQIEYKQTGQVKEGLLSNSQKDNWYTTEERRRNEQELRDNIDPQSKIAETKKQINQIEYKQTGQVKEGLLSYSQKDNWYTTEERQRNEQELRDNIDPQKLKQFLWKDSEMSPNYADYDTIIKNVRDPIWVNTEERRQRLGRLRVVIHNLENAEEELKHMIPEEPETITKDDIKSLIKLYKGSPAQLKDIKKEINNLQAIQIDLYNFPINFKVAINQRIQMAEKEIKSYHQKGKKLEKYKQEKGILLNQSSRTRKETEEAIKTFNGEGVMSFNEWQGHIQEHLKDSGIPHQDWGKVLIKKVSGKAIKKISPAAKNNAKYEDMLNDLNTYFNDEDIAVELLMTHHKNVGSIPDTAENPSRATEKLRDHLEVFEGSLGFINNANDKNAAEDAVFTRTNIRSLLSLMPIRIRQDNDKFANFKKNPKTTYMEIMNWMKTTLHNLQTVEVQTLQMNTNHNILIAMNEKQNDLIKSMVATEVDNRMKDLKLLERNDRRQGFNDRSQITEPEKEVLKDKCPWCKILKKESEFPKQLITDIMKQDFWSTHTAFRTKDAHQWRIGPVNCMAFLSITAEERVRLIQKHGGVCKVCCAENPSSKSNSNVCDRSSHRIIRPKHGLHNGQLCSEKTCDNHFLLCTYHVDKNRTHPLCEKSTKSNRSLAQKANFEGFTEVVLVIGEEYQKQDKEISNILLQKCQKPHEEYARQRNEVIETVEEASNIFEEKLKESAAGVTIIDQEQLIQIEHGNDREQGRLDDINTFHGILKPSQLDELNPEVKTRAETVLATFTNMDINGPQLVETEKELLMPQREDELVVKEESEPILLYIKMHAEGGRGPVTAIYDTGASCSVFTPRVIGNHLRATVYHESSVINGVGSSLTQVAFGNVVLPGNVKDKDGYYRNFIAKATIMPKIINPLDTEDHTELINEIIEQNPTTEQDPPMILENFNRLTGGIIDGLIGCRQLNHFPTLVMALPQGLGVYRHFLRPHGSRSKVYCLGGTKGSYCGLRKEMGGGISMIGLLDNINNGLSFDGDVKSKFLYSPIITKGKEQ